jgi:O-antigen/teichoic acid export membrane protein
VRAVGTSTVSQAFSAASNFVILLALGRAAGAGEVGKYALAFVAYTAALIFQRASLTSPLLARKPASTAPEKVEVGNAITLAAIFSGGCALVALAVGLVTPYKQLMLVAPFLVGVLVEDSCRFLLFRREQHGRAVVVDGLWLMLSCTSFLVLRASPGHSAAILVWGTAGSIAGIVGVFMMRTRPGRPVAACRWWKLHLWRSSRWLSIDSLLLSLDLQIAAFGFTAVAGAKLYGQYQIALSLVGVSVFLTTGIGILAVTRLARSGGTDKRWAAFNGVASFACGVTWTIILITMSGTIVRLLYGDKVRIPTLMLVAAGAFTAVAQGAAGPQSLLQTRHTERAMAVARGMAVLIFPLVAVLVAKWNFEAALWVLVADGLAYLAVVSWVAFRSPQRAHVRTDAKRKLVGGWVTSDTQVEIVETEGARSGSPINTPPGALETGSSST